MPNVVYRSPALLCAAVSVAFLGAFLSSCGHQDGGTASSATPASTAAATAAASVGAGPSPFASGAQTATTVPASTAEPTPGVAPSAPPSTESTALPAAPAPATGLPVLGTTMGVATTVRDPVFDPLPGASGYHGRLGAAGYRIEFPLGWHNGPLVLWAHGFRGFGTELSASNPPRALREAIIGSGYAWAASSYTENGYAPGVGADDTLALLRFFEQRFGMPSIVAIAGESMGGNVTVLALEHFAGELAGGLSFCGAVGGEEQIDYLLSWAMLGEYFSGIRLPIGEASPTALTALFQVALVLGAPGAFNEEGRQFESAIRALTGGPRPFFAEGLADQFTLNFGLLAADPARRMVAVAAATNASTIYSIDPATGVGPEALNAGIRRLEPLAGARDVARHPDAVPTTGRLSAPLLSLHNTGDLFVPISLEVAYREKVQALGRGDLLVQRAIRDGGHCRFSSDEYAAAWRDFRAWIEAGVRPEGEFLGADLSDAGRIFTQPFRTGDPGGR